MKTTIILMAAVLASSVAYASGSVSLSMKPAERVSAFVEILNEARNEVDIDVTNEYGEVVFSKKVAEPVESYKRKYDFSGLDDGRYILSVNSGNELNQTRFEMSRGSLTVTDERKIIEPHVTKADNIWKLAYLNFALEKMNLYVYEGSRLLHREKIEPVFAVQKGLDLSGLLPGEYQIVFANDYDAFQYNVEVK